MSKIKKPSRLVDESIIRARCPNDLKEKVVGFARANNFTESDFIREAVEQYLAHLQSGGQRYMVNPFIAEKETLRRRRAASRISSEPEQ